LPISSSATGTTSRLRSEELAFERIVLDRFLDHPICLKRLSELRAEDLARYRDDRLKAVSPTTLKRQLNPIRHLFQVAQTD